MTCFWCGNSTNSEEKYNFCSRDCLYEWGDEYMSNTWRDYATMMGVQIIE